MIFLLDLLFIIVCLLLIFMVVITPSQEQGIASAFGGMGSDTFFGTKAHQHINKFTIFLAVSFILLGVGINFAIKGKKSTKTRGSMMENTEGAPAPAPGTNTPAPPPK